MAIDLTTFKQQLIRLLRENWPSTQMLAEEIFAVLNQLQDSPDTGPTKLSNDGQDPVLSVQPLNGDTPAVQFKDPKGNPAGGYIVKDGKNIYVPSGKVDPSKPPSSQPGGAIPGLVQSGGPGQGPYSVDLYENDRSAAKTRAVNVTVMQIDSGDTVPSGSWVYVTQEGDGTFSMQPMLWLK